MKKLYWLICIFLIPSFVFAEKWKQASIEVTHGNDGTQIYVTDYNNKKLLALNYPYFLKSPSKGTCAILDYDQQRDIVYILYFYHCDQNKDTQGAKYVDLTNSQVSKNFGAENKGPSNYKEHITLLYDKKTKIFSLVPMFEDCKKTFTIEVNSNDDGPQINTVFLPNGNLFLEYAEPSGKFHTKTIPIDYKKLYADCRG
jgi:hypothetical protein